MRTQGHLTNDEFLKICEGASRLFVALKTANIADHFAIQVDPETYNFLRAHPDYYKYMGTDALTVVGIPIVVTDGKPTSLERDGERWRELMKRWKDINSHVDCIVRDLERAKL